VTCSEGVSDVSSDDRTRRPSQTLSDRRSAGRVLAFVCLACFFSHVSWTGLTVALPTVVRALEASPTAATWLVLAPQLAATAFMIGFGRLADILGRRALFLGGVGTFTIASLLCGLSPNAWTLVGLLVLVAIASGAIVANGAAVLVDAYPSDRLSHALGIYVASFSTAALLGPSVGGLVADTVGWRWLFWLSVPVGAWCCLWGRSALPRVAPSGNQRLDLAGFILIPGALLSVTFALTRVGEGDWSSPGALASFGGAALAVLAFALLERRARDPIVDFDTFRHPPFALAMTSAFVNAMARSSVPLLLVLYLQAAQGVSALEAGLKVMPMSAVVAVVAAVSGRLTRFGQPRTLALVGSVLTTAGIALLPWAVHQGYPLTALALAIVGAGSGIFLPSNANVVMVDAPDSRVGVTNAIRLTIQSLGALLCTALCLTVLTASLDPEVGRQFFAGDVSQLAPTALPQLYDAYDRVLALVTVLACAGTLAAGASWLHARRHAPHQNTAEGAARAS
jgi:EmrB/QacA subfamily drug resistance transporter